MFFMDALLQSDRVRPMKSLNCLIWYVIVAAMAGNVVTAESVLDRLAIGVMTPKQLEKTFAETRTEIPGPRGDIVVHFKDINATRGQCRFFDGRLYRYDVIFKPEGLKGISAGGWDELVSTSMDTLGKPIRQTETVLVWHLEDTMFQVEKKSAERIAITLCDRRIEQLLQDGHRTTLQKASVRFFVHGGPHFFKGFRPKITSTIKLSFGIYSVQMRYRGRGNFIVTMESATDSELVANTIGRSHLERTIRVADSVKEVFFSVERASGPWEIRIEKIELEQ
jgi:hypothetical protein